MFSRHGGTGTSPNFDVVNAGGANLQTFQVTTGNTRALTALRWVSDDDLTLNCTLQA